MTSQLGADELRVRRLLRNRGVSYTPHPPAPAPETTHARPRHSLRGIDRMTATITAIAALLLLATTAALGILKTDRHALLPACATTVLLLAASGYVAALLH